MTRQTLLGGIVGAVLAVAVTLGIVGVALGWQPQSQATEAASMMGGNGMMGSENMMGPPPASPAVTPVIGVTTVRLQHIAFQPAHIRVPVGTTITWTNDDAVAHTVTFTEGMMQSATLNPGDTYRHTFTTAGTYQYYCMYHSMMIGWVTVTA